jgi:hypothetical protein
MTYYVVSSPEGVKKVSKAALTNYLLRQGFSQSTLDRGLVGKWEINQVAKHEILIVTLL